MNELRRTIRSLFVGATSPKNEPEYYCACVMELINFHRNVFTSVPLIINTHGWIKGDSSHSTHFILNRLVSGTGLDMLIKIIRYAQPMHLVHLITPKDNSMDFMFFEGEGNYLF
jgi:polynucleotide 5'-hydroxyl-kinase GRC3/NOL9